MLIYSGIDIYEQGMGVGANGVDAALDRPVCTGRCMGDEPNTFANLRRIGMGKNIVMIVWLLAALVASAGVTTHLGLDCRKGVSLRGGGSAL